jgi:hypothetical protein
LWRFGALICLASAAIAWQHELALPSNPLPERSGPLRKALLLLRESKTAEARKELEQQRKQHPDDAEVLYQIARSYFLDFYRLNDAEQRRVSTTQRRTQRLPARPERMYGGRSAFHA